jgi:hypothetical protein
VAVPQVRCRKCGRKFTPRRGTRRVNCYECRPERTQAAEQSAAPVSVLEGATAAAVRAELERSGQAGTVTAAVALRLAVALDDPGLAAAQVASMSAKLLQVMEPLARMGVQVPDEVDEFSARLAAKRATA